VNCRRTEEILRDSGPRDVLPPAVRQHLDSCPACTRRAAEYRRLDSDLEGLYAAGFRPGMFESTLAGLESRPRPHRRFLRRLTAAAAVLLLLAGAGIWVATRGGPPPTGFKPYELAIGDSAPASFEDVEGAQVCTRAKSRAVVSAPRRVKVLEGAALFEVEPGRGCFVVEVPDGTVCVVGTEFSVSVGATSTRVVVRHGRVRLENAAGRLVLNSGQGGELPRRSGDRVPAAPAVLQGTSVAEETLWRPWNWLDRAERAERLNHLRGVLSREPYQPRLAARELLAEAGEDGLQAAISWARAGTPRLRLEAVLFLGRAPAGHGPAKGSLRAVAADRREQPGIRAMAERSLEAVEKRKPSGSRRK